jgi:hypothetical protein
MDERLLLRELAENYTLSKQKLVIACVERNMLKTLFSDWEWLNIGLVVSEKLLKFPKNLRKQNIVEIVKELIDNTQSERIVVENIDILFSPEYSLDVIKLFVLAGRSKTLVVNWCGKIEDGFITYSEPIYEDYHRYEIKNYDVYCITK